MSITVWTLHSEGGTNVSNTVLYCSVWHYCELLCVTKYKTPERLFWNSDVLYLRTRYCVPKQKLRNKHLSYFVKKFENSQATYFNPKLYITHPKAALWIFFSYPSKSEKKHIKRSLKNYHTINFSSKIFSRDISEKLQKCMIEYCQHYVMNLTSINVMLS